MRHHPSAQQSRLQEDLRGLIKGDVRTDEVTLQLYATDASILQVTPQCVVYPKNIDDVAAVCQYASENGIPLHPRGSGTSLTGESLGEGIILAFSRYMRRMLKTDVQSVTIQPGLLRRRLNGIISRTQHRRFGPVAGHPASASLGSILARNGAGLHYLRYGLPSDHLISLTVVLANGSVLKLNSKQLIEPIDVDNEIALAQEIAYGKEYVYAGKIARQLGNRSSQQRTESLKQLPVNRAGYAENAVLTGDSKTKVNLSRLFLGSEGTLGIIVEAELKTVSMPNRNGAVAFFFRSIFDALEAAAVISPMKPVICEMIDRRKLSLVRDWDIRYQQYIPAEAEALLLIELNGGTYDSPRSAALCKEQLRGLIDLIHTKKQLSFYTLKVDTEEDFQLFDQIIRRSELVLGRMKHSIQPIPLFDDVAVPLNALNQTVNELITLFQQHKITASLSGHIGQGHLRIYPILDFTESKAFSVLRPLADSVYEVILGHGGTISSEWGTGLLKSKYLPKQFPESMTLFRKIKETFDPLCLLNPGKVIPNSGELQLRHGLKKRGRKDGKQYAAESSSIGGFAAELPYSKAENEDAAIKSAVRQPSAISMENQLRWNPDYVFESAHRCNGCGECLRYDRYSRICPLFRGSPLTEWAPRAKADLLRGILEHDLDLAELTQARAKEIADSCFHCRMCDIECPAQVDVSVLAFRCKAAYAAAHGLSLTDLMFSRLDNVLDWLLPCMPIVNVALRNKVIRWVLEKTLQIPQRRIIPNLTHIPYLNRMRWSPLRQRVLPEQTEKPRAVLFVDLFANYFNPKLADWAVQILEYNGFSVHVPVRQRQSGQTSFAVGHANRAEKLARYNTAHLLDLIQLGYKIVTIEPYSAACLTKDYRHLIEENEADILSSNVLDFCSFLLEYHRLGKLRTDFQPLPFRAGYHAPCSALAVSASLATDTLPAENLLHLIPELKLERIDRGCCGMGGYWGFKHKNYRQSLHIGIPLFREMRLSNLDFAVSDCIACCSQIAHGTQKRAFHPIRLLASAYGLTSDGMKTGGK